MDKKNISSLKGKKLKVCLYLQNPKLYAGSGIGQAINHQQKALELNNIEYTLNPKDLDYQILHVNSNLPGTLRAIRKAKKLGKKIVIHAHQTSEDFKRSFFFSDFFSPALHKWLNYFYSQGDIIVCPSPYTKDLLKRNYSRLKDKKIIAISNGIDIDKWKSNKKRGEKFKKDYKIKNPIVFAVGLVFPRKGIVDFIKTSRTLPNFQFMWVGKYLKKLVIDRKLNYELKNKPKNFLLTGFVKDIIGAYSAGDIFFFPSYEENEGIVILEAAAMGKAIVVRDIPVFRSYLKEGKNCLMAKTNEEFAKKINHLLTNKKLNKNLSKNAKKLAKSKSLKNVGKELKRIYFNLLLKKS